MPGFSKLQERFLSWIICTAILVIISILGFHQLELIAMPDKYVRMERYKADTARVESGQCRIESKLDQVILSLK
jgi:hypothetical protein